MNIRPLEDNCKHTELDSKRPTWPIDIPNRRFKCNIKNADFKE